MSVAIKEHHMITFEWYGHTYTSHVELIKAARAGLLTVTTQEHTDRGYYCGTWYTYSGSILQTSVTVYNPAGFGFSDGITDIKIR